LFLLRSGSRPGSGFQLVTASGTHDAFAFYWRSVMKRFLGFAFAMFFALVALALVGGDSGAVAGHGCHGRCHGGLHARHHRCHGEREQRERCHGLLARHRNKCHGEAAAAACDPCAAASDCGSCGGEVVSGCSSCGGESYGETVVEGGCAGGGCGGEGVISDEVISEGVPTEAPPAPAAT
jgi:hypothetical protein